MSQVHVNPSSHITSSDLFLPYSKLAVFGVAVIVTEVFAAKFFGTPFVVPVKALNFMSMGFALTASNFFVHKTKIGEGRNETSKRLGVLFMTCLIQAVLDPGGLKLEDYTVTVAALLALSHFGIDYYAKPSIDPTRVEVIPSREMVRNEQAS